MNFGQMHEVSCYHTPYITINVMPPNDRFVYSRKYEHS